MNEAVDRAIEWSLLNPLLTREEIERQCAEGIRWEHHAVTVPSGWVEHAREAAGDSELKINCLIGFPFGGMDGDAKRFETEVAADGGAHEIELVMNLARFKARDYKYVLREVRDVAEAADERPVKVLIEQGLWSEAELRELCALLLDSGARFLSTSTGMNGPVAGADQIETLRELLGDAFGIKASGLRDFHGAETLIASGATRLGNAGFSWMRGHG